MAVNANAGESYDNVNVNEELHQTLVSISPIDTPFYTSVRKGTCNNTLVEWPVYELAAQDTSNRVIEGEASPAVDVNTLAGRVQNYTQISDKLIEVTHTAEALDDAGKLQKMAKQMAVKMKELKRDKEGMLLANVVASAGSSGTARQAAGLMAWVKTNTVSNAGTDPTMSGGTDFSGYPNAAAVGGTPRTILEDYADTVMRLCYEEGGEPTMMMVNPVLKPIISGKFTGNATRYKNAEDKRIVGAVDFWVSDFGEIQIVPNRFQPLVTTSNYAAIFVDPQFAEVCYLEKTRQKDLAATGHSERRLMWCEYTLKVANEKAHGIIRENNTSAS